MGDSEGRDGQDATAAPNNSNEQGDGAHAERRTSQASEFKRKRPANNIGRKSRAGMKEKARGWTPYWGTGRYFKNWGEEHDKLLRGTGTVAPAPMDRRRQHDSAVFAARRGSKPLARAKSKGWVQHCGDGRYFRWPLDEVEYKQRVKSLGDFKFKAIKGAADKGNVHDSPVNAERRQSKPLPPSKSKGWVKHAGEGRYFEWPLDKMDAHLRGTGFVSAATRPKSCPPKTSGGSGDENEKKKNQKWKPHFGQAQNFHGHVWSFGLQDCDLAKATEPTVKS